MAALVCVKAATKGANGDLSLTVSVLSSVAVTVSMTLSTPGWVLKVAGLSRRSRPALAAAALKGVPSENLTPVRSGIV